MKIIGVTGGSGTGKTVVCQTFQNLGAYVIDADQTARKIVEPGSPVLEDIICIFGKQYIDNNGHLNRRALAHTVFSDEKKRLQLNAITHPAIIRSMLSDANKAKMDQKYSCVCFDAPLLIEGALADSCDYIIAVLAPLDARIDRIMMRDGLTREEAQKRIGSQPVDFLYEKHADFIIMNNKSESELKIEAKKIFWSIIGDGIGN